MKKIFALFWTAAILLLLFAGCQSPRDPNVLYDDPLTDQLKEKISAAILEEYNFNFDWDCVKPDVGTINDCTIVVTRQHAIDFEMYRVVIEDYEFWNAGPLFLFAYRNGEVCYLREAYENGWLTKEHIGLIHEKYEEIGRNYEVYYREWAEAKKEAYNKGRYPDVLYSEPLSEDLKAKIKSGVSMCSGKTVRWGYVDPYYGTINNCSVVIVHPFGTPKQEAWSQEIAGYIFEWDSPIDLYVYYYEPHGFKTYTLQTAYENGLLTEKQIGVIHERHEQYRMEFPYLLEEWEESRKAG